MPRHTDAKSHPRPCPHASCSWAPGSDGNTLREHMLKTHGRTRNLSCCKQVMGQDNKDIILHREGCVLHPDSQRLSQAVSDSQEVKPEAEEFFLECCITLLFKSSK
ncbi:uncharacterized protein CTRU02_213736 [Colletotrichum truncatum]|uniref:Uncharacterized protein n=1 Tax=Colletotrichum truncatum TaxID=5467 RepID=A0ACC3YGM1_COLTU|nr:uncharacterized protein CTRU02_15059 [Colletotrichum truncatum]KAF6781483.1 hypothetical protein CTRU02_15059 [Colletotrichum truncatum]